MIQKDTIDTMGPCCTMAGSIFTPEQLALLDPTRIPKHIAIIPDGNRRWAKAQKDSAEKGHHRGANTIIDTVKAALELGVKTLTFYCFSTENWTRSPKEIHFLMWLLEDFLNEHCAELQRLGVKFNTIGNLQVLPKEALMAVERTRDATAHCQNINMVAGINYGARDELCRTFQKIAADAKNGKLKIEEITEGLISGYLDTAPWGDPDLFIRTSGEMRISNYLLWQLAYAEIYFTNVLWPDFKPANLFEAVTDFQNRERRWGGQ